MRSYAYPLCGMARTHQYHITLVAKGGDLLHWPRQSLAGCTAGLGPSKGRTDRTSAGKGTARAGMSNVDVCGVRMVAWRAL